jgi:hypothetical protein
LVTSNTTGKAGFGQSDLARWTRRNRGAETMGLKPLAEVLFELAELPTDGLGPRPDNGSFNPGGRQLGPFVLTPGASDAAGALHLGEVPNARQDGCHSVSEGSHFNKIFASLKANFMLQEKGCKSGRFASFKTPVRRCQSRPKHCLGETYADLIYTLLRCIGGPSLLGTCPVSFAE